MPNAVNTPHKDYTAYFSRWQRVRDIIAGQDAIYARSFEYLPPLKDETPVDYQRRLNRTPLYNASWHTVHVFTGLIFRKSPTVDVPERLKPLLDDVTLTGLSLDDFAREIVHENLTVSRGGILVDYPAVDLNNPPKTIAEQERRNLRPSLALYKVEAILNWRFETVNNRHALTQVRLLETKLVRKNEFEDEEKQVIRVLDLHEGKYRVRFFDYESGEQDGDDRYLLMNGKPLTEIPFYFFAPEGSTTQVYEPVLIDLFNLNIKHFQVSADYEHGCHMTALPTPVITGVQPQMDRNGNPVQQQFYIGSTVAWTFPDSNAKAFFLEFSGAGLSALEKNLDRKEQQMAAIGARMLTPDKAGVESEGALMLRHSGEHSILSALSQSTSQPIEKALRLFAMWAGVSEQEAAKIKYSLNRDFMPFAMTPASLTALLSAVQSGKLSHQAFFDLLQRGDLIDAKVTFEDEQSRIEDDLETAMPPPLPPPPAGNTGDNEDEGQE